MDPLLGISVYLLLFVAVYIDVREHRLPNRLTFLAAGMGAGMNLYLHGPDGLLFAAEGWLAGFLALLPLYLFAGMGGGDVKLMAGLGAFLGPKATVVAACLAVLAGGLLGAAVILRHGGGSAFFKRYRLMLQTAILQQEMRYIPPPAGDPARLPIAYAIAIALGTVPVTLGLGPLRELWH